MNKINTGSLNFHDGSGWTELIDGLATNKWYNVEIVGNVNTGQFDLTLYQEDLRDAGDPALGRLLQSYDLDFRDDPTELAYVMLSNEGSGKDAGAYTHRYDDLYLVPEPATMSLLALGLAGLVARRRRK